MDAAAEQSSSSGLLISDQLNLSDGSVDIVFGCETKETGEIYNQEADGILGLGNSEVSLVNQVIYPSQHKSWECHQRSSTSYQSASLPPWELSLMTACVQRFPLPSQAWSACVPSRTGTRLIEFSSC